MTRLDLQGKHARTLSFETEFALSVEELAKIFPNYRVAGRDGQLLFFETYSAHHTKHLAFASLRRTEAGRYHLDVNYGLSVEPARRPKGFWTVTEALQHLEHPAGVCELAVDASFVYERLKFESRVRLPIRLAKAPNSDFDEITGLRLAKLDEDGSARYSVIADQPNPDTLANSVSFRYTGRLTADTLRAAFNAASDIAGKFVSPRGVDGGEKR